MSRPKGSKNKPKQVQLFQEVEEVKVSPTDAPVEVDTPAEVKKQPRINGYCSCCEKEIYSGLIYINLSSITGKANWSRTCSTDKLTLCNECAEQLSTLIDNWIVSKNPKLKKPFCIS